MKDIIFTDLDGTLLDKGYSFKQANAALDLLKSKNIPLIFCTSKTFEETLEYAQQIGVKHPFIVESGGAIYVPSGYFSFEYGSTKLENDFEIIELGSKPAELNAVLATMKKHVPLSVLSELTPKQIVKLTGLPIQKALLVTKHKHEFALIFDEHHEAKVNAIAKQYGFTVTKGRFYFLKSSSKGDAVKRLSALYKRQFGEIKTYAIGDSANDESMLEAVDEAYVLRDFEGKHFTSKYNLVNGSGPEGWKMLILKNFC